MWTLFLSAALAAPLSGSPLAECPVVARVDDGVSAQLASGICAWHTGQSAAAADTLQRIEDPDLRPWARLYEARALLDLDRHADAIERLDGVTAEGRVGLDIRLARGEALVRNQRSLEARPDLRALLSTEVGEAARYWLAVGGEDRGARDAAIATYRAVWTTSVRGPWAPLAEEGLERLGAAVPDPSTPEGKELIRTRATALSADKQPLRARDLLELIETATDGPTGQGLTLARARAAARDYEGALEVYEEVLGDEDSATGSAQDLFDYALATARTGDYETASELYARLMDQHPGTRQADTASFKRGYMSYDERDCESALPLLEEHLQTHPQSRHADEALWFASRCAFLQDQPEYASELLKTLSLTHPDSSLAPGARYWVARAAGMMGDADVEREGLEEVLRRWPVSGYAWFAAERLGRQFTARASTQRPALAPGVAQTDALRLATKLYDAGLDDDAVEQLSAVGAGSDRQTRLAVAHMLIDAGAIQQGRTLVRDWCGRPWSMNDTEALAVCLPRPEHRFVEPAARSAGLDPSLSYAIMTAESALRPEVSSAAGARGLMQVMPAEGPRMHTQAFGELPGFDADRLFDPSYNAALGSSELSTNTTRLGDHLEGSDLPAVIASYNAGEEAVRRWLDGADGVPADAWSEEIGYSETRKYVRRVLGFWMAYRWAYGDPSE